MIKFYNPYRVAADLRINNTVYRSVSADLQVENTRLRNERDRGIDVANQLGFEGANMRFTIERLFRERDAAEQACETFMEERTSRQDDFAALAALIHNQRNDIADLQEIIEVQADVVKEQEDEITTRDRTLEEAHEHVRYINRVNHDQMIALNGVKSFEAENRQMRDYVKQAIHALRGYGIEINDTPIGPAVEIDKVSLVNRLALDAVTASQEEA
jgi:hypothetical protein